MQRYQHQEELKLGIGLLHQVVGDQFGMGIDDTHMKIRGAPVLDEPALSPHQKMIADKLAVSELMSMAVVALPPIVKVRCPTWTSRATHERHGNLQSVPEQPLRTFKLAGVKRLVLVCPMRQSS